MFSELSLLEFRTYLECSVPQVPALHHSSWSILPIQVAWPPFIILSFSSLSSFYFSSFAPFSLYFMFLYHLFLFGFHLLYLPYMLFNSAPFHHQHHIILFSLCPLEVNLHTYITTWLSSCPVGISFGFVIIFCLKIKNS